MALEFGGKERAGDVVGGWAQGSCGGRDALHLGGGDGGSDAGAKVAECVVCHGDAEAGLGRLAAGLQAGLALRKHPASDDAQGNDHRHEFGKHGDLGDSQGAGRGKESGGAVAPPGLE